VNITKVILRLVCLGFGLWQGTAFAGCPDRIGGFEVASRQIQIEVNNGYRAAELAQAAPLNPGFANGYTSLELGYSLDLVPGDYIEGCRSTRIVGQLLATRSTIFIANDLDTNGCQYHAVLDHELKHVQAAQEGLDFAIRLLKERISNAPKRFSSTAAWGDTSANLFLKDWLQQQLTEVFELANNQLDYAKSKLDTAPEAEQLRNLCDNPFAEPRIPRRFTG
jgi:hypothetical protein